MPHTFIGFLLLALLLPLVFRINRWISEKQVKHMNERQIMKQLRDAAASCKQYLHDSHPDKLDLVVQFIASIEDNGNNLDIAQWGQFRDIKDQYRDFKDIREEMLKRVESSFDLWIHRQ